MYEEQQASWTTPKGNQALFTYRWGTSDWNTLQSCTAEDEYKLRDLSLTGEARFLTSPLVGSVAEWRGEWHPPHIDEAGIHALLDATHAVTTWGPGPGGFRAVRR